MWWKNWLITRLGYLVTVAGPRQTRFFHDVITQDSFPITKGEPDIIVSIDNNLNNVYIKERGGGAFSPPISKVWGGLKCVYCPQHLGNSAT